MRGAGRAVDSQTQLLDVQCQPARTLCLQVVTAKILNLDSFAPDCLAARHALESKADKPEVFNHEHKR